MNKDVYYKIYSHSRNSSGTNDFKNLFQVFVFLFRELAFNKYPSSKTFEVTQDYGYELVEKRELKRLKKKYEVKK